PAVPAVPAGSWPDREVRPLTRPGTTLLRGLRRTPAVRPERCGLCSQRVDDGHRHLADTAARALVCVCIACALLFERPDGQREGQREGQPERQEQGRAPAQGRYLPLPDRCLTDPGHEPDEAAWTALRIPVSTAFVLDNTALGRRILCYPSPAGATEAERDEDAWRAAFGNSRLAAVLRPDVEALLLRRTGDRIRCLLVPVDVCYELVGRMRLRWRGFDGGAEANADLDAFFADLAERAEPLPKETVA
ncbi:DUF5947 family protein, partial [Streptomyces clavuligerus]